MITTQKIFQSGSCLSEHSDEYASIHTRHDGSSELIVLNANEFVFKDNNDIDAFVIQLRQFMKEKENRYDQKFKKIMAGVSSENCWSEACPNHRSLGQ